MISSDTRRISAQGKGCDVLPKYIMELTPSGSPFFFFFFVVLVYCAEVRGYLCYTSRSARSEVVVRGDVGSILINDGLVGTRPNPSRR